MTGVSGFEPSAKSSAARPGRDGSLHLFHTIDLAQMQPPRREEEDQVAANPTCRVARARSHPRSCRSPRTRCVPRPRRRCARRARGARREVTPQLAIDDGETSSDSPSVPPRRLHARRLVERVDLDPQSSATAGEAVCSRNRALSTALSETSRPSRRVPRAETVRATRSRSGRRGCRGSRAACPGLSSLAAASALHRRDSHGSSAVPGLTVGHAHLLRNSRRSRAACRSAP